MITLIAFFAFISGFLTANILLDKDRESEKETIRETPPLVRWMSRPVGSKPITYEDWKKENGIKE